MFSLLIQTIAVLVFQEPQWQPQCSRGMSSNSCVIGDYMYYDENGLIVQKDMDGGDTAGREGDYWFQAGLLMGPGAYADEFDRVLKLLQVSPGVFIRNPRQNPVTPPDKSWNDPTDFSRDQSVPIILALGAMNRHGVLKSMLWEQIKRGTLYQNKDIALPQDWGYYIRALNAWYLYPVLFVGDTFLLINSVIRCIMGTDDNTSDDVNHTMVLLQAQYRLPTPISWFARKFYKFLRRGGIQNAWDKYFKPESGANPFNELYRPLINNM